MLKFINNKTGLMKKELLYDVTILKYRLSQILSEHYLSYISSSLCLHLSKIASNEKFSIMRLGFIQFTILFKKMKSGYIYLRNIFLSNTYI